MAAHKASSQLDPILVSLVQAQDEVEHQRLIADLICSHSAEIIKEIVHRRLLRFQRDRHISSLRADAEDLYNDIVADLLKRLSELSGNADEFTIHNYRSYVAGVANNACYDYLRSKYPQRASLKNKLRYLLTSNPEFALWQSSDGEWLCGLAHWHGRETLRHSSSHPLAAADISATSLPAVLLSNIFRHANAPLELDELITLVADAWGVRDHPLTSYDEDAKLIDTHVVAPSDHSRTYEQRFLLQGVWSEINQLPARQRAALVLNLRDSQGADLISLILDTRTATITEVAAMLDMSPQEFLEAWDRMPLDDLTIADLLGLTQRQIIKLRRAARERLQRRLKGIGGIHFLRSA